MFNAEEPLTNARHMQGSLLLLHKSSFKASELMSGLHTVWTIERSPKNGGLNMAKIMYYLFIQWY